MRLYSIQSPTLGGSAWECVLRERNMTEQNNAALEYAPRASLGLRCESGLMAGASE